MPHMKQVFLGKSDLVLRLAAHRMLSMGTDAPEGSPVDLRRFHAALPGRRAIRLFMKRRYDDDKEILRMLDEDYQKNQSAHGKSKAGKVRFRIIDGEDYSQFSKRRSRIWTRFRSIGGHSREVASLVNMDEIMEPFGPEHPLWVDVGYHGTYRMNLRHLRLRHVERRAARRSRAHSYRPSA